MDITIINITTPPPEPVTVEVTEELEPVDVSVTEVIEEVEVNVSSTGETGPPGPAGPGIEPIYQKTFGSITSDTILPAEHGLTVVRGVTVLAPNFSEVEVYVEQRNDNSVFIDSNSNLNNYILKLY